MASEHHFVHPHPPTPHPLLPPPPRLCCCDRSTFTASEAFAKGLCSAIRTVNAVVKTAQTSAGTVLPLATGLRPALSILAAAEDEALTAVDALVATLKDAGGSLFFQEVKNKVKSPALKVRW